MERTLVIVKPDAVRRGLVGEIVGRLERKGLTLVEGRFGIIDRAVALEHYAEHDGKPFFDELIGFITSGPALVLAVEGQGAIAMVRSMMGATNPADAQPGSIRGDLATEVTENLVHGSDSPASAERELTLFFG